MNNSIKKLLAFSGLLIMVGTISSCATANFCSVEDKAHILYAFDTGVTAYYDANDTASTSSAVTYPVFEGNTNVVKSYSLSNSTQITTINTSATSSGYLLPSIEYWSFIDNKVLDLAFDQYIQYEATLETPVTVTKATATVAQVKEALYGFYGTDGVKQADGWGYIKYFGSDQSSSKLWEHFDLWTAQARIDLGIEKSPSHDYYSLYKSTMEGVISNNRACIATVSGQYGSYGSGSNVTVSISEKTWAYAWGQGFFEGLIVYPVSWMIDTFAVNFGAGGWGQIWAIVLITIIVRSFILLVTFKSVMGQQRMTEMQPEIAKIQQKYPNSNTNQAQKQRMAQETTALYKKYRVNPLSQILVMIVQFPVFICVWGAMQGSAILSSDSVLGLNLSSSISTTLLNFTNWPNTASWWTALVLFILMAIAQFIAMKVPQWIQKSKQKKIKKLSANPAQDKNQSQMRMVSNIMVIMIIVMGFMLPAAMGVYWLVGAIYSLGQSLITTVLIPSLKGKRKVNK